jgi:hypothetical protein
VWDCGLGGANCGSEVTFDWATTDLGIGGPRFAIADILGPFQPILSVASSNFASSGTNAGLAGQTVNYNVEFSHPFYVTNGTGGGCSGDAFGDDADANCDGTVTNAELIGFIADKFDLVNDGNIVDPNGVQIRDSSGADILVNGDINDARRIFMSFTLVADVQPDDVIHLEAGEGVTSLLDPLQSVFPFDQGPGGTPNSDPGQTVGDGDNNTNELQDLLPYPSEGEAICPQTEFGGPEPDQC